MNKRNTRQIKQYPAERILGNHGGIKNMISQIDGRISRFKQARNNDLISKNNYINK